MKILQKASGFEMEELKAPTIHGRTEIVLKNVKTGLVDRVESENTFQSAVLANAMRCLGEGGNYLFNDTNFNSRPVWANIVGGILLFRDQIPVGSHFMPAGNQMTGNGAYNVLNGGVPTEMGSFSRTDGGESSASASAITQVYDFTTAQANGLISCVCLTSYTGGYVGYGNQSGGYVMGLSGGISHGQSPRVGLGGRQCYYNGYLYTIGEITSNRKLTISKAKRTFLTGSVFSGLSTDLVFDMDEIEVPSAWSGDFYTDNYVFDCGNGIFRFVPWKNAWGYQTAQPGQPIYFFEFDAKTDELFINSVINSSSVAVTYTDIVNTAHGSSFAENYIITNGGYIFDIDNGTYIGQANMGGGLSYERSAGSLSNGLIWGGNGSSNPLRIFDVATQTERPINAQFAYADRVKRTHAWDGHSTYHNPLYLATINNLGSPVTKTAAQTMKVTYTLTEV